MSLEELEDFGFGEVEAEGFEGDFKFVVIYSLVFVQVEEGELGECGRGSVWMRTRHVCPGEFSRVGVQMRNLKDQWEKRVTIAMSGQQQKKMVIPYCFSDLLSLLFRQLILLFSLYPLFLQPLSFALLPLRLALLCGGGSAEGEVHARPIGKFANVGGIWPCGERGMGGRRHECVKKSIDL